MSFHSASNHQNANIRCLYGANRDFQIDNTRLFRNADVVDCGDVQWLHNLWKEDCCLVRLSLHLNSACPQGGAWQQGPL